MKKGYHSTQSKAFNTIPRSEYLGVVLGFAIGMFLTGALHWDNRNFGADWCSGRLCYRLVD